MEKITIKLNIRNEPKLMCIVTDIVGNVNLVNVNLVYVGK